MHFADCQVNSDSDESLDCYLKKTPKIPVLNGQIFNRDISIDEGSQNYDEIKINNYSDLKNQNLNKNQTVSPGVSDEDSVLILDGEFEVENDIINETNSKTSGNEKTDDECIKEVGGGANDYDNDEERINTTFKSMGIDSGKAHNLLDKKKILNEHKNKAVTQEGLTEHEKNELVKICKNYFDTLPENWIELNHRNGMPMYFHLTSGTVTLSRPFILGPGDCKSQVATLSAICSLQYQKYLKNKEIMKKEPDLKIRKLGNTIISNSKVETVQENIFKGSLTHVGFEEFCLELIPNIKSHVVILSEYLQKTLKPQPWYEFKELENTETPFCVTVKLNDIQYGVGLSDSKKQAKLNAAKATLDILLSDIKYKIHSDIKNQQDLKYFKVSDHRIAEFCAKTSEPSPYNMLILCLKRNFRECRIDIEFKLNSSIRQRLHKFTMTVSLGIILTPDVGKHTASVYCMNKNDGKQRASQLILGLLHPHIDYWGSLIMLYGNRYIKGIKEKKQEQK